MNVLYGAIFGNHRNYCMRQSESSKKSITPVSSMHIYLEYTQYRNISHLMHEKNTESTKDKTHGYIYLHVLTIGPKALLALGRISISLYFSVTY
jgi:hypothetical protein